MTYPVGRGRFMTWLESRPPESWVGYRCDEYGCPIASFLVERLQLDVEALEVDRETVIFKAEDGLDDTTRELPGWAQRFIEVTDNQGREYEAITREEALEVMGVV